MTPEEQDKLNQYLQFRELLREYKKVKLYMIMEFSAKDEKDRLCTLGKDMANRIKLFRSKER